MTNSSAVLHQTFQAAARFVILSHVRPDGDAYGSALGLGLTLRALGKEVDIVNQDGLSDSFRFLPGSGSIHHPSLFPPEADQLIVAVDTSDLSRLGTSILSWNRKVDVVIDHHVSNPGYGIFNHIVAQAPATAAVLYDLFEAWDWPLSAEAAANLYVGLMTDTGSFRYRSTTARTLEVASRLVQAGANPADLAQACYRDFAPSRFFLQREVNNVTHFRSDYRVAWFTLTPEIFARAGASSEETEGLVEPLLGIRTVEVAFVLEEMPDGLTRGSLRSRGTIDVQHLCSLFGGGGHRSAAGFRCASKPEQILPRLLAEIDRALSGLAGC